MNVLVLGFILALQVPGEPEQHGAERGERQEGGESPGVFHGHPPFPKHHPCGSWRQAGARWPLECGECSMCSSPEQVCGSGQLQFVRLMRVF